MKTGREVAFPKMVELPQHWEKIPRRKAPDERYTRQCRVTLERFAKFVGEYQGDAIEFVAIKPDTAKAFMAAEEERGVSPKTWNDTLKLLRATFKHLHPQLNDGSNPFHGLVTKAMETINREPFSVEELKAIMEVCAKDDFIRPVILTGMCTAMRRGDCCLLKWKDVDLKSGFITVKTAKTGQSVDIPIFPLLREELERARTAVEESLFCFPKAAAMYETNPDGITWRVKQVLGRALALIREGDQVLSDVSSEEVRVRGLAHVARQGPAKRTKMRAVFTAYLDGQNLDEVIRTTGCSRGTVSNYLNELERETSCPILRGKRRGVKTDALQIERENGKRRASVHDFHSFRVTWITLALAAGVPLELVQRVTGHRTVAVVLKHYFRPGREDFRQVLTKAMPKMLADGGQKSLKDKMREILERMSGRTWKRDQVRLLELLSGL
jgi:integrase